MLPIVLPYDETEIRSRPSFALLMERNLKKGGAIGDDRPQKQRDSDAVRGSIGELLALDHAASVGAKILPPSDWRHDFIICVGSLRIFVDVKTFIGTTMSMTHYEQLDLRVSGRITHYLALNASVPGQMTIAGMAIGEARTLENGLWQLSQYNSSMFTRISSLGRHEDTFSPFDYLQLLQDSKDTP
jgi:hypothetical protein